MLSEGVFSFGVLQDDFYLHLMQFVIHSTRGAASCVTHLRVTAELEPATHHWFRVIMRDVN